MLVTCEGIVLKMFDYSEADLMMMVFTDKLGRVSVYGKNAKKLKSRISQSSQVMCYSKLNLDCSGGMYKLHSAEVIDNFYSVSTDLDRYYAAFYILEIVNRLLLENQGNMRAFKLVVNLLQKLKSDCDIRLLKIIFRVKLLKYLGVKPEIQKCISCGKELEKDFWFNFDESGCSCSICNKSINSTFFDKTVYKLMEYVFENDIEKCFNMKVSPIIIDEVECFLDKYYKIQFE